MVLFWKAAFVMIVLIVFPVFAHVQPSVPVGPPGSLPHFFVYHSEDHPNGAIPNSSAPLKEWVPDLAAFPTRIATSGRWSQIWGGSPPGADDVVLIPADVTVVYDLPVGQGFKTLGVKGAFVFDPLQSAQLRVGTIEVYDAGTLTIKPASRSIVHEVLIDGVVNPAEDPGQFGNGILSIGGVVDVVGAQVRTPFAKFVRASAGESTITLVDPPLDWQVGDDIYIAGYTIGHFWNHSYTVHSPAEIRGERFRITGISGMVISLNASLQYTHTERREVFHVYGFPLILINKTFPREPGVVAHVTRNVVIKSVAPDTLMRRGHITLTGTTNATFSGAYLEGLGRTTNELLNDVLRFKNGTAYVGPVYTADGVNQNCGGTQFLDWNLGDVSIYGPTPRQVPYQSYCNSLQPGDYMMIFYHNGTGSNQRGRYALHAHHLHEEFSFADNVIFNPDADLRWGIVSHNSFGVIDHNVVIWKGGGGIVAEYGTETGPITDNLVLGMGGGDGKDDGTRFDSFYNRVSVYDYSQGGFGYWFGGRFNEITHNIADGLFRLVGFDYYIAWYGRGTQQPVTRPDSQPDYLPLASGSPPDLYGGTADLQKTPNRLFSGNTNYAFSETGHSLFTEWDMSYGSIIHNYTSYYGGGFSLGGGENTEIILDGVRLYGAQRPGVNAFVNNQRTQVVYVHNSHIENFQRGIAHGGELVHVENTTFVNVTAPFEIEWNYYRDLLPQPAPVILRDVRFITPRPGNVPPSLMITAPHPNAVFNTQSVIALTAAATDPDGSVVRVAFFANHSLLNSGVGFVGSPIYNVTADGALIGEDLDGSDGWSFSWTNPPPGRYTISARAIDSQGASTTWSEIPIEVLPGALTTPLFYRGIDFGNTANLTIRGNQWEYRAAPNYRMLFRDCTIINVSNYVNCPQSGIGYGFPLYPTTDANTTLMLRNGFQYQPGRQEDVEFEGIQVTQVPAGTYHVYLYTYAGYDWDSPFSVVVNNITMQTMFDRGVAGSWGRLGPFTATSENGAITIQMYYAVREGRPPFLSGIELWRLEPQGQAINQPPRVSAAVAQVDSSNPLVRVATLQGSVTDDGLPANNLTYFWKVHRAPDATYFSDPFSLATTVRLFHAGVYQFQIVASDGMREVASNIITVDVPSLPTSISSVRNAQLTGATFYRGINLGGPALTIDGNMWDGATAGDYTRPLLNYTNASMVLYPRISEGPFADMLRDGSATISGAVNITNIPTGTYQARMHVVTPYGVCVWGSWLINGRSMGMDYRPSYGTGTWTTFGPYTFEITDGRLSIDSFGSYCGRAFPLAGIELWRVPGTIRPLNQPPLVDAGFGQTITLPATASLLGTVQDDGGSVSSNWSVASGGSVGFLASGNPITSASFPAPGTYVLRLTASDGDLSSADEVTILVRSANQILRRLLALDADGTRVLSGQLKFVDRSSGAVVSSVSFSTNSTGQQLFDAPAGMQNVDLRIVVNGYLPRIVRSPDVVSNATIAYVVPILLAGDFNNDAAVNSLDWSTMNRNWFLPHALADINKDNVVNSLDFSFLSKNWLLHGE